MFRRKLSVTRQWGSVAHRSIEIRIVVCLASLSLLGLVVTAQADITLLPPKEARKQNAHPEPVPPEPVPVNISVRRGGTVEIPLRVFGVPAESFTYLLRTLPTAGKVSEPKVVGRGLGAATYEHRNGNTQDHDHFRFATRTDHGISGSVEVSITIVDDPPVLNVLGELDFGMIAIGTTATRELTIENRGGGVLAGTMTVEEPWKVEGKETYHLRSGERQSIRLRFAAQSEQTYLGQLRFSSHPSYNTPLSAVSEAVVAIAPNRLELLPTTEITRSGILTITNRTETEQPLRLHITSKLSGPDRVTVPAHGQISITIATTLGDVGSVDDEIEIHAPGFAAKVPVHAPAAAAIILASPASLTFGKVVGEQTATALLQVANIGGTRVLVRLESPPPIVFANADAAFWLEPGMAREVTLSLERPPEGTFDGQLRIQISGKETIVPIDAEVTVGKPLVKIPAIVNPTHEDAAPVANRFISASIMRISPTTCEIKWQPVAGDFQYKIAAFAKFADAQGETRPGGNPLPDATILEQGGDLGTNLASHGVKLDEWSAGRSDAGGTKANVPAMWSAVIKHLKAGSPYEVRVLAVDSSGVTIHASQPLQFRTLTWWTYAGHLRFVAPLISLLVIATFWRAMIRGIPPLETAEKSDSEPKPRPTQSPVKVPFARREPAKKKYPMMREVEPGRFVIDLGETD